MGSFVPATLASLERRQVRPRTTKVGCLGPWEFLLLLRPLEHGGKEVLEIRIRKKAKDSPEEGLGWSRERSVFLHNECGRLCVEGKFTAVEGTPRINECPMEELNARNPPLWHAGRHWNSLGAQAILGEGCHHARNLWLRFPSAVWRPRVLADSAPNFLVSVRSFQEVVEREQHLSSGAP